MELEDKGDRSGLYVSPRNFDNVVNKSGKISMEDMKANLLKKSGLY